MMLKFLTKNRYNVVAIKKLRKQDRDTNEEFERVKRLRLKLGVSGQCRTLSEVENGTATKPIEEAARKASTCFRKKKKNSYVCCC